MYYTKLYGCIRINALNGFRKPLQTVYTGNENILNSTVLKVCQHAEPEVCSLISWYIHSEELLMSFPVNTQHIIYCTCNSTTTFIRYFVMNGIHPDYRINRIKHPWFPCFYLRKYTVCDGTDCVGRNTIPKIFFHPVTDFPCAVSHCIQANYTVSNTFCQNSLTLLDKLGIKTRITVTGSGNGYFAQGSLNLLLHLSVTTVTHLAFFFCQMCIHLSFQGCIQYTFQ